MASQWYTNQFTGGPIYSVGIEGVRHFTEMTPLPGAYCYCSSQITDGDDTSILDTCQVCSLATLSNKFIPPPPPEEPITPDEDGNLS